jgi:hypothetical protein
MVPSNPGSCISKTAGELLTASGIITRDILVQAVLLSQKTTMPLGRILVMSGHIAEGDLTSSLKTAQLVMSEQLPRGFAVQALKEACSLCIPVEQILDQMLEHSNASLLGRLLLSAGLLNEVQISIFNKTAISTGTTLGSVLVKDGTISVKLLSNAIDLLAMIRDSRISFEEGARAIRLCCMKDIDSAEALVELAISCPLEKGIKLGQLLVKAGVLTEFEALAAAETGLEKHKQIGEVLFESKTIEPLLLRAAISLQGMVNAGSMSLSQAQEIMYQVHTHQQPVERVLAELGDLKRQIVDFLKSAKILTEKEIKKAIEKHPTQTQDAMRSLLVSGTITMDLVKATVKCLSLVHNVGVRRETAMLALLRCYRKDITLDEAFNELAFDEMSSTSPNSEVPAPLAASHARHRPTKQMSIRTA